MLHVNAVLVLILAEIAAGAVLALFVWGGLVVRRRARDRKAVGKLIESVTAADSERRTGLSETLAGAGLTGETLEAQLTALIQGERRLYKSLIDAYVKRDAGAFSRLDTMVCEAIAPYRALLAGGGAPAAATEADTGELDALRAQNESLRDDLESTKRTMSNMLTEYAQIYERGDGTVDKTTASKILIGEEAPDAAEDVAPPTDAQTSAPGAPDGAADEGAEDGLMPFDGPLDDAPEAAADDPFGGMPPNDDAGDEQDPSDGTIRAA